MAEQPVVQRIKDLDPAKYGDIDPDLAFETELFCNQFALVQVVHHAFGANYRVVRFCNSDKEALALKNKMEMDEISVEIFPLLKNRGITLAKTSPLLRSKKYQTQRRTETMRMYLQRQQESVDEYVLAQKLRNADKEMSKNRLLDELKAKAVERGENPNHVKLPEFPKYDFTISEKAKVERLEKQLDEFNNLPWIKRARAYFGVHPSIDVKPGSCQMSVTDTIGLLREYAVEKLNIKDDVEADLWAKTRHEELIVEGGLNREVIAVHKAAQAMKKAKEEAAAAAAAAAAATASSSPSSGGDEDENDELFDTRLLVGADVEEDALQIDKEYVKFARGYLEDIPTKWRSAQQRVIICAHIIDETENREPLVLMYGTCSSEERAIEIIEKTLKNQFPLLSISVLDMYQWICPEMMQWMMNSSEADTVTVSNLHADDKASEFYKKRRADFKETQRRTEILKTRRNQTDTFTEHILSLLRLSQRSWDETVKRVGDQKVYTTLFSLPSVQHDYEEQVALHGAKVVLADIFHKTRVLTDADYDIITDLFKQNEYTIEEADAALEQFAITS